MDPISIALGLAQFVPGIVRWVAGEKAGEAAQTVVNVAQAVTGKATGPEALEAIRADAAVQRAFQERMAELSGELDKAYLADRQDARQTEVELAKIGASNARRKNAMIVGDVIGLIVCIVTLVYVPDLPGEVRGIISTIAGFFGLGLRDAHQFEFGSSRGSELKTGMLAGK